MILIVTASVRLVDLGMKVLVFRDADKYEYFAPTKEEQDIQVRESKRQRQRELSSSLSMLIIGAPLYFYHWNLIKKEGKKK